MAEKAALIANRTKHSSDLTINVFDAEARFAMISLQLPSQFQQMWGIDRSATERAIGFFLGRRRITNYISQLFNVGFRIGTLPFAVDPYRTEDERLLLALDIGYRGRNRRKISRMRKVGVISSIDKGSLPA